MMSEMKKNAALVAADGETAPCKVTVKRGKASVNVIKWGEAPFAFHKNAVFPDKFRVTVTSDHRRWIGETKVEMNDNGVYTCFYRFSYENDPTFCSSWCTAPTSAYVQAVRAVEAKAVSGIRDADKREAHLKKICKGANGKLIIGVGYPNLQREIRNRLAPSIQAQFGSSVFDRLETFADSEEDSTPKRWTKRCTSTKKRATVRSRQSAVTSTKKETKVATHRRTESHNVEMVDVHTCFPSESVYSSCDEKQVVKNLQLEESDRTFWLGLDESCCFVAKEHHKQNVINAASAQQAENYTMSPTLDKKVSQFSKKQRMSKSQSHQNGFQNFDNANVLFGSGSSYTQQACQKQFTTMTNMNDLDVGLTEILDCLSREIYGEVF